MRGLRLKFMLHLYGWSSKVYAHTFKCYKKSWNISKEEFLEYPTGSIGRALGDFYHVKGFDVMPKLENHDVFHVLTNTGTEIQDEIAMQYLLLGNGKISIYLLGMVCIGTVIFPEHVGNYTESFRKGKSLDRFYHLEFKYMLSLPLQQLKTQLEVSQLKLQIK